MGLGEYKRKRDFKKTAEPAGAAKGRGRKTRANRFIIQKHDASRLHYDFRLEMEGVLKSWAVPKGLPWAQAEKHLAVEVEDHPIEYADFEGIIPAGQYGGGTVMVWDRGTYELTPPGDPMEAVRTPSRRLIRARGRTARAGSNQSDPFVDTALADLSKAKPCFIEPMKPKLVEHAPTTGDWLYELKFDGIRALAIKNGRTVQLISRNEKKLNDRFPEIVQAAADFDADECVVDGEVVAMDGEGRSSFQLLQGAELDGKDAPLAFYVFDLLQLNGRSLIGVPLTLRKEGLRQLVPPSGDIIRFSGAIGTEAETLLPEIKRRGLEGLSGKQRDPLFQTRGPH